jgi:hypothetical protein
MTDLLKEAIADAKAVREVALANAKLALEEAFQPRIQSMIATKLSEEAESDEEMTEGEDEWYMEGEEGEETMEEGDDEEMPVEEGDDEEPAMEEAEEEMPVEEGDDEETPMEEGDDEEIDEDLMEIIRQLEEELDSSEIGKGDNKQPSKYASDDSTTDKKEKLVQLVEEEEEEAPAVEEGDEEEADIKEILRALREEDEESEMEEGEDEEKAEMEEKVNEAYAVIQFLREKLNEVNLLNSKLLFSNKLFRSYSLTESQKVTVIENFDRAGSLREVKLVYATLAESFKGRSMKTPKSTKKSSLKESFASKPQASTRPSKKILTESNQVADRFKKLAGLL